jgi:hypothetical protein
MKKVYIRKVEQTSNAWLAYAYQVIGFEKANNMLDFKYSKWSIWQDADNKYYHDYNNLDYPINNDGFMSLYVCLSHLKACLLQDGYEIIDKDEFETLMVYI